MSQWPTFCRACSTSWQKTAGIDAVWKIVVVTLCIKDCKLFIFETQFTCFSCWAESDCNVCVDFILFCRCKRVDTHSATDDITMTVSSVAVATTVLLVVVSVWSLLCVTLVHGTSFQYYTDQWAVEILSANESYAEQIAQRHGFTYVTTVSSFTTELVSLNRVVNYWHDARCTLMEGGRLMALALRPRCLEAH